jgi:lipid-A-disaccharide synthase
MGTGTPLIYLIAGEPSGDAIGARLISGLNELSGGEIEFTGLGGEAMMVAGFESLFPIQELSVMGLVEVLPHARRILRRINEVAEDVASKRPDLIVTIDSPSFSARVANRIADLDIPKVHYVAPTVWAWRAGRVHKFKRYYDHLMAILPFEPRYFEKVGLPCAFVGHPVLEYGADKGDGDSFRYRHNLPAAIPLICALPGSRRGEVGRHIDIFGKALEILGSKGQDYNVVIPTLSHLSEFVRKATAGWPIPPVILDRPDEKYDAMAASAVSVAASGTVSLETAIARVPTVIAYKVNRITGFLVRRLIRVDFVNILNILADREIVPECLQEKCSAENLATSLADLMGESGDKQIAELAPYIAQLGNGSEIPSMAAAKYLLSDVLKTNAGSH